MRHLINDRFDIGTIEVHCREQTRHAVIDWSDSTGHLLIHGCHGLILWQCVTRQCIATSRTAHKTGVYRNGLYLTGGG